jgi:hypothetical protein
MELQNAGTAKAPLAPAGAAIQVIPPQYLGRAIITFQPPRRIFDRRLLSFVDNLWPGIGKIAAPGHKHGGRARGTKLRAMITKT